MLLRSPWTSAPVPRGLNPNILAHWKYAKPHPNFKSKLNIKLPKLSMTTLDEMRLVPVETIPTPQLQSPRDLNLQYAIMFAQASPDAPNLAHVTVTRLDGNDSTPLVQDSSYDTNGMSTLYRIAVEKKNVTELPTSANVIEVQTGASVQIVFTNFDPGGEMQSSSVQLHSTAGRK